MSRVVGTQRHRAAYVSHPGGFIANAPKCERMRTYQMFLTCAAPRGSSFLSGENSLRLRSDETPLLCIRVLGTT